MGLWDKMKGAMNTLTGGGAEVQVEVGEATLGSSFEVVVTAKAKAKIYLFLKCPIYMFVALLRK